MQAPACLPGLHQQKAAPLRIAHPCPLHTPSAPHPCPHTPPPPPLTCPPDLPTHPPAPHPFPNPLSWWRGAAGWTPSCTAPLCTRACPLTTSACSWSCWGRGPWGRMATRSRGWATTWASAVSGGVGFVACCCVCCCFRPVWGGRGQWGADGHMIPGLRWPPMWASAAPVRGAMWAPQGQGSWARHSLMHMHAFNPHSHERPPTPPPPTPTRRRRQRRGRAQGRARGGLAV